MSNQQVASELGIWPQTVGKWRRRFVERRLEGLVDKPRPGAPRKITDERIEQIVVATLERPPKDATHWSRTSMAAESGLSRSTVGRIWKAFGLKPVALENWVPMVDLHVHAAQWYWLIKPSRTGCRRMERTSARSVIGRVTVVSMAGGR